MSLLSSFLRDHKIPDHNPQSKARKKIQKIVRQMREVVDTDLLEKFDDPWEEKYNILLLGKYAPDRLRAYLAAAGLNGFKYYDPDTSYEDDCRSYVDGLVSFLEKKGIFLT